MRVEDMSDQDFAYWIVRLKNEGRLNEAYKLIDDYLGLKKSAKSSLYS